MTLYKDAALAAAHCIQGPNRVRRGAWIRKMKVLPRVSKRVAGAGRALYLLLGSKATSRWLRGKRWFYRMEAFHKELPDGGFAGHVLTSQPPNISHSDFAEMRSYAELWDLRVTISMVDAWADPGNAPLIVWESMRDAVLLPTRPSQ